MSYTNCPFCTLNILRSRRKQHVLRHIHKDALAVSDRIWRKLTLDIRCTTSRNVKYWRVKNTIMRTLAGVLRRDGLW